MSKTHYWQIRFRNDTMGFTRKIDVEAAGVHRAIIAAEDDLEKKGYMKENFEVTEATRGREVGT